MFGFVYAFIQLVGSGYESWRRRDVTNHLKRTTLEEMSKGNLPNPANVYMDWRGASRDLDTDQHVIVSREFGHLLVKDLKGNILRDVTQREKDAALLKKKEAGEKVEYFNAESYLRRNYYDTYYLNWDYREETHNMIYIHLETLRYCTIETINFKKTRTKNNEFIPLLDENVVGSIDYYVDIHTHEILGIATERKNYPYRVMEGVKVVGLPTDDQKIRILDREEERGRKKFFEVGGDSHWKKLDKIASLLPLVAEHAE